MNFRIYCANIIWYKRKESSSNIAWSFGTNNDLVIGKTHLGFSTKYRVSILPILPLHDQITLKHIKITTNVRVMRTEMWPDYVNGVWIWWCRGVLKVIWGDLICWGKYSTKCKCKLRDAIPNNLDNLSEPYYAAGPTSIWNTHDTQVYSSFIVS